MLDLNWNDIHDMGQSVIFDSLPNLEILTLSHNSLHDYFDFLYNLTDARNITKLDMSYQTTYIPVACGIDGDTLEVEKSRDMLLKNTKVKTDISSKIVFPIWWPPKLEWLSLASSELRFNKMPGIFFALNGSVKHVDISNNIFETLPQPFYCYHTIVTMEYADISNCEIQCVTKGFFDKCVWSLKYLNASHNKIGLQKGGCNENPSPKDFSTLFKPLNYLVTLDISFNYLTFLRSEFLQTQNNLVELRVSNNELSSWDPNMTHMVHLELLDLSHNNLADLSKTTRMTLDQLEGHPEYRTKEHISLNLDGNPLSCTCPKISFLKWLADTTVNVTNLSNYTCTFYGQKKVKISVGIHKIISDLESECTSRMWLILNTAGLSFYMLCVTTATLWFRFRHNIRYFFLKMRMRRERLDALLGRHPQYQYDAFLSCTREGAKWGKKYFLPKLENDETGLTFCVAQRDFVVGKTIIDNIMDTINKSRKTVLLVDQTFINSKWCNEELLLSHHVSTCAEINLGLNTCAILIFKLCESDLLFHHI